MFRIDISGEGGKTVMKVVGRLGVQFAQEVRRQVLRLTYPLRLTVDLADVTFVDHSGEEVLSWLGRMGVEFVAQGFYCLDICEKLHLGALKRREPSRRLERSRCLTAVRMAPDELSVSDQNHWH